MHKLQGKITSEKLKNIDVCIVDAMFFIRTLSDLPVTYGALAKLILDKLLNMGKLVDLVCDRYVTPSIKDLEHIKRNSQTSINFSISGSQQKWPSDFHSALNSGQFKTALFRFLLAEWSKPKYASIIKHRTFVIGIEDHA